MTDLWQDIQAKIKDLMGGWASYVALGSFLLYVLGYLAIRFHLTTLGIGTDLAVLDERYVFAGAKFLVYLFGTLPIALLFALVLAVPVAVIAWVFRLLTKKKAASSEAKQSKWSPNPVGVSIFALVISVLFIQIVMRKCFSFVSVLVEGLPDTGIGLEHLLTSNNEYYEGFFFLSLLGGTIVCGALWLYAQRLPAQTSFSKSLNILLASLVILQFLFLPINYGVFIMDKDMPRVLHFGDEVSLPENQKAWLVWEGNHGLTYLVHETGCPAPAQTDDVTRDSTTASPVTTPNAVPSASPGNPASAPTTATSPTTSPAAVSSPAQNPPTAPTSSAPSGQSPRPCTPGIQPRQGIIRKLVTLPQKDLKRTEILEYDRLSTLTFFQR